MADQLSFGHSTKASSRGLHVTIGRSADFYGPSAATSVFTTFALDRIAAGKAGTWFFNADQPHSLTYTPDIGHALAIPGTNPEARGRPWHLSTAPAFTGRPYIELAGGRAKIMGPAMMRLAALFNPDARETLEMAYQYVAPSVLDSTAFEVAFGVPATRRLTASQPPSPTAAHSRVRTARSSRRAVCGWAGCRPAAGR